LLYFNNTCESASIFYGENYYPYWEKKCKYEVNEYETQYYYPNDSLTFGSDSTQTSFYRKMPYLAFINQILLNHVADRKCPLGKLEEGTLIYINCPLSSWESFYLDKLMRNEKLSLTPIIDIIKVKEGVISHQREMFVCEYTENLGFSIQNRVSIQNEKVICR
jgi:hypothetical protein